MRSYTNIKYLIIMTCVILFIFSRLVRKMISRKCSRCEYYVQFVTDFCNHIVVNYYERNLLYIDHSRWRENYSNWEEESFCSRR